MQVCNKYVVKKIALVAALVVGLGVQFSVYCLKQNEIGDVIETWLPEWGNVRNYGLKEIYMPSDENSDAAMDNCNAIILTGGDKLYKENSWLLSNRVSYAKKHGYCYFHVDCYLERSNCLYPHYWRYIGIIKIYNEFRRTVKSELGGSEKYLLYLDTDTMIVDFNIKIEDFANRIVDSNTVRDHFFLGLSVDDNCDYKNYAVNTGVMLMSLSNVETLLFSLEVVTLQKMQSLLSYVPEWSVTGLNDQNIVVLLLNETKRLNLDVITDYCEKRKYFLESDDLEQLNKHDYFRNINVNTTSVGFRGGVYVFPNRYLNNILRVSQKNRIQGKIEDKHLLKGSWILHFSGSDQQEQKYLIYKVCSFLKDSILSMDQKGLDIVDNAEIRESECPHSTNEIITSKQMSAFEEFIEGRKSIDIDQSNYVGQSLHNWIENIIKIELGITNLCTKHSKLAKR